MYQYLPIQTEMQPQSFKLKPSSDFQILCFRVYGYRLRVKCCFKLFSE